MNVKPLRDYVVVRAKEEEHVSTGGIVIPDSVAEKSNRGEVLEVGGGKVLKNGNVVALSVKPGDQILYAEYAGNKIKVDNEEFLIMHESEILAVLDA